MQTPHQRKFRFEFGAPIENLARTFVIDAGNQNQIERLVFPKRANAADLDAGFRTHALGTAPDAVGDQVFLEASAEEIKAAGVAGGFIPTHVTAKITCANSADRVAVGYIFEGNRVFKDQTADIIS